MEYYSIKNALIEGTLVRIRINADVNHPRLQEVLKGRSIRDRTVCLPYHMVECLLGTEYVKIESIVSDDDLQRIEGCPYSYKLGKGMLYGLAAKEQSRDLISDEARSAIKAMHLKRAVKGVSSLGEQRERVLGREEREIMQRGRHGWRR